MHRGIRVVSSAVTTLRGAFLLGISGDQIATRRPYTVERSLGVHLRYEIHNYNAVTLSTH